MRTFSILYHDVVAAGDFDQSGFPGPEAARYKLTEPSFKNHLTEIARCVLEKPVTADHFLAGERPPRSWLIHFDDGGCSAMSVIAELLNERKWRGHFYVSTDFIGRPGFLKADDLRTLRRQGHVIGSHSCSHPVKISGLGGEDLVKEWQQSREILSDIIGEQVRVASVPGGFYSRRVAAAAAAAGLGILFTSEPKSAPESVKECLVLGRYAIVDNTPPSTAAALAAGKGPPRWRQYCFWNFKKLIKTTMGPVYAGLWSYWMRSRR